MKEILLDYEKCNGCMACAQACAAEHSESKSIIGAILEGVPSRIFVQSVDGAPFPIICRHCEDAPCVDACMAGAMQKDPGSGVVTNEGHAESCVGCWMCIMACPYGAVARDPRSGTALKCDRCPDREAPACVASCPNHALLYMDTNVYADARRTAEGRRLLAIG